MINNIKLTTITPGSPPLPSTVPAPPSKPTPERRSIPAPAPVRDPNRNPDSKPYQFPDPVCPTNSGSGARRFLHLPLA